MKICISLLITLLTASVSIAQIPLMPIPYDLKFDQNGKFRLEADFNYLVIGSERLEGYTKRIIKRIINKSGVFIDADPYHRDTTISSPISLQVSSEEMGELKVNEDESYKLSVNSKGISIRAVTDIGAMRGLETLSQLLLADTEGYYFPYVSISDEPRFTWRGLLIDFSRHWMPMEVVKRNLDGMAMMKMNVLHMHLTEDQGFRIESKVYPKLQELGSNGEFYTQNQIKEIIDYASNRGIRVVPEFDMPGHTTSWFVGYPELASASGPYKIETSYGVQDPIMDPTKEYTYEFLDNFLTEMSRLFPDDYFHIGGDENNGKHWDANSDIQAYMKSNGIRDNHELQGYFNSRLLEILEKNGKRMMGWDEIFQPGISKDILIQSWRGKEALVAAAEQGYQAILSNGYYIDLSQKASFHYLNDPLPEDSGLSQSEARNILGGEATMWSEVVTAETIDSRIWPRTAAIAERLWSPQDVKDVDDMYERLDWVSIQLEEAGLQHKKYQGSMLRRLAAGNNIESLKTLVNVIEPVKIYSRHSSGVLLSTYAPFTRLADVSAPESMVAREFELAVDSYLESGGNEELIFLKELFVKWVDNHPKFLTLIETSPILKDAKTLSLDLSNVSKIGLQALSTTANHTASWRENANIALDSAKEPRMECELAIVESIRKLVAAAK